MFVAFAANPPQTYNKAFFNEHLAPLSALTAQFGARCRAPCAGSSRMTLRKCFASSKTALGDGAWCAWELVWMTLGLSAKFFPRARAPLADEACDLLTDLVCDVYFV